jgi:ATP-dependent Clp protease ATP-binding subunit ClpA
MFERFTHLARNVVIAAQGTARELDAPEVGNGHLLLGILHEPEGLGGQVLAELGVDAAQVRDAVTREADAAALRTLGIDLDAVRRAVDNAFGPGALDRRPPSPRHLPFAAAAKKSLELSLREALRLRSRSIGTEHILLGLLRHDPGVGGGVLRRAGVDHAAVESQLGAWSGSM